MRPHLIFIAFFSTLMVVSSFASANWRSDIGVFRIGVVIDASRAGSLDLLEPFRMEIAESLGMDVEFFPARDSINLINALSADRIEYAILSSSGYALATVRCACVEPLVIPRSSDSTDGYYLVAIGKRESVRSVENLLSKQVAALSADSIIGEALIRYLLLSNIKNTDLNSLDFQKRPSSEETLTAFTNGEFDVLFGWSSLSGDPAIGYSRGTLNMIGKSNPAILSELEIFWRSSQIPHRPHVIRKKLPGEAKTILRDTLVNLFERNPVAYDAIEPHYAGGFTAARTDRFKTLVDFIQSYSEPDDADEAAKNLNSLIPSSQ